MVGEILQLDDAARELYFQYFVRGDFPSPSRIAPIFTNIGIAKSSLEKLLINARWDQLPPLTISKKDIDLTLVCTSHGETSNKKIGELLRKAGIPYPEDGILNGIEWLTGQSGTMLSEKGKKQAKESTNYGQVVVCSDLPRAIHAALLKYAPETESVLDRIANEVLNQVTHNQGIIKPETYHQLVRLALEHNIIPTPLTRAAFYGRMEGFPAKVKGNTEQIVNEIIKIGLAGLFGEDEREKIKKIVSDLKQREDATFFSKNDKGERTSENKTHQFERIGNVLDLFLPTSALYEKVRGRTIDLVGHSGSIDGIVAYYRHPADPKRFEIERLDKRLTQSTELQINLKEERGSFVYLNDPRIKMRTRRSIFIVVGIYILTLIAPPAYFYLGNFILRDILPFIKQEIAMGQVIKEEFRNANAEEKENIKSNLRKRRYMIQEHSNSETYQPETDFGFNGLSPNREDIINIISSRLNSFCIYGGVKGDNFFCRKLTCMTTDNYCTNFRVLEDRLYFPMRNIQRVELINDVYDTEIGRISHPTIRIQYPSERVTIWGSPKNDSTTNLQLANELLSAFQVYLNMKRQ